MKLRIEAHLLAAASLVQGWKATNQAAAALSARSDIAPLADAAIPACAAPAHYRKGTRAFLAQQARTAMPEVQLHPASSAGAMPSLTSSVAPSAAAQPHGSARMLPAAPGFEDAFAYACLQDAGAYAFATTLLERMDVIIGKMLGQATPADNPDGAQLKQKANALRTPILAGAQAEDMALAVAEKNRLNHEVLALNTALIARYAAVYGEAPLEIGTSGFDPVRIQQVIAAQSPQQGVQLREKMALIHHVMEWFPHEVQKKAGVQSYASLAAMQSAQATMTDGEQQTRYDRVRAYLASLALDFPVSAEKLADFCQWWMHSDTVRASYHTKHEERTPHGRKMNAIFFEQREDVRDFLDRSPWVRRPLAANRTVNLAMADPHFAQLVATKMLDHYQPYYEKTQTDLLNGSCYFVLNEQREWYQQNLHKENLIVATGPSGTADILQRLADVFAMPMAMKINGVKAAIAHMHLDDHHSLHEVLSATDGNPALNGVLGYDGTLASLERLDANTFAIATALQPHFLSMEIDKRNRLESHRRAVFGISDSQPADLDSSARPVTA